MKWQQTNLSEAEFNTRVIKMLKGARGRMDELNENIKK